MQRREFTLKHTKNGDSRTVPMTPDVYRVFTELWQERRLDTQRVFLYNEKPIWDVKTVFVKACRQAQYEPQAGRGGRDDSHEGRGTQI